MASTDFAPAGGSVAGLARNWWAMALRGVVAILFGLIALFQPGTTMLSLVLVFAAYALVDGILAIVAGIYAMTQHERWGLLLFEGVIDIVAAAFALLWPGITVIAFVGLLAGWSVVTGGLMLGSAFRLQPDHGRWWMVLGGIASILYGALLIGAPLTGAVVLTWWLGAYAIVFGVALIILGFRLRSVAG